MINAATPATEVRAAYARQVEKAISNGWVSDAAEFTRRIRGEAELSASFANVHADSRGVRKVVGERRIQPYDWYLAAVGFNERAEMWGAW